MIQRKLKPPPRGAFDWMLGNILDEVPHAPAPPPPPRDPEIRRVVVNIEITPQRRKPKPKPRADRWLFATMIWLIVLAMFAFAHAQPVEWQSYRQGFMTHMHGNDADGRAWTGQSYRQGFMTYTDVQGPGGQSQHCRSWQQDWRSFTQCD